ncbi:CapA family protein [bacterium]|nr:CapA family protein [bacterium]
MNRISKFNTPIARRQCSIHPVRDEALRRDYFLLWSRSFLRYNTAMFRATKTFFISTGFLPVLLLLSHCASVSPKIESQFSLPIRIKIVRSQTISVPCRHVTMIAGGDVLPGCFLDPYLKKSGYAYPYEKIAPLFKAAQIGLVNLECPLSNRGKRYTPKKFTFRANPQNAPALRDAGINAVCLGNNHIMDYGAEALEDTLAALDAAGVAYAGAGKTLADARRPAILTLANQVRVAILSYSLTYPADFWASTSRPGTAFARLPQVAKDVRLAAHAADWVVVCFHWGGELKHFPKSYQKQFGRAAIDAGAHVVVGSHPHVLQGVEWYQQGLILYSLGNLAFGGGRSKRAVESALIKVEMDLDCGRLAAWAMPLNVNNTATAFIPTPLPGKQGTKIFNALQEYSKKWGTRVEVDASGWGQLLPPLPEPGPIEKTIE